MFLSRFLSLFLSLFLSRQRGSLSCLVALADLLARRAPASHLPAPFLWGRGIVAARNRFPAPLSREGYCVAPPVAAPRMV